MRENSHALSMESGKDTGSSARTLMNLLEILYALNAGKMRKSEGVRKMLSQQEVRRLTEG